MKIVTTFSNKEYVIEDDEAENLEKIMGSGQKFFVKLRCGVSLNTSAIESIDGIPKIKVKYNEYPVYQNRNGSEYYMRDGSKIAVETQEGISYIDDPKYKNKSVAQITSGNKLLN